MYQTPGVQDCRTSRRNHLAMGKSNSGIMPVADPKVEKPDSLPSELEA